MFAFLITMNDLAREERDCADVNVLLKARKDMMKGNSVRNTIKS